MAIFSSSSRPSFDSSSEEATSIEFRYSLSIECEVVSIGGSGTSDASESFDSVDLLLF